MNEADDEDARYGCPNCLSVFRFGFSRCPIDGGVLQKLLDDPLVGTTFADRYFIEECIGEGGMGRVYRARHQRVSRRFAIKILFGDLSTNPVQRDRFAREAEAASRLSHANVISVMDFGETPGGILYLVMDFVEGLELGQVIYKEGPFAAERIVNIVKQLCLGLGHAHEEGLIHRDFKGENVILSSQAGLETPRIVDFGIAVMLSKDQERLTTDGLIIGTPKCMSPEQVSGQELDARSDLFSLGVLMYELLAGVGPYEGDPIAIARQNMNSDPPPISERVPGLEVDPALEQIARKLLENHPDDRFQNTAEVLEALEMVRVSENANVSQLPMASAAPYESTFEIVAQVQRRRPTALVAMGLLLVAGAVTGALLLKGGDDESASSPIAAMTQDAGAEAEQETPPPLAPTSASDAAVVDTPALDASVATLATPSSKTPDATRRPSTANKPDGNASKANKPDANAGKVDKPDGNASKANKPDTNAGKANKPDTNAGKANKPDTNPPATKEAPTSKDLTDLYVSVGEALQKLKLTQPDQLAKYQKDYAAIPFNDALRIPAMRIEVENKLRRLSRSIQKATKP